MRHSKGDNSGDKSNSKKSNGRIKKDTRYVFDPDNVRKQLANQHKTLWENLTKEARGTRFLRVPYCLFNILSVDEATFLARLLDLEDGRVNDNKLRKDGSFFCSQSFLNKSFCMTTEIQKRIISKLKSRGYITTWQVRFGKRFIRIMRGKLEADLVKAQEIPIDNDGSPIVPKGSPFARRGDHSKTREDLTLDLDNDTKC